MKFLIAGLGSIGRRHLKNLISLGEKDIILYRSNLSSLSDNDLSDFQVETDIMKALKHNPDGVIISNPTSLHLDIAIPAAEAGCSIFLEKPVSHSFERINELKLALQRGGGQLLVGFQFRFHPTLKLLKNFLLEEKIGKPVFARVHWGEYLPDWHPWEDFHKSYAARTDLGGGVVLTLCHPFDYLNWLFGKPEFLYSQINTIGDFGLNVEDIADVNLKFPNETFGTVHLDYIQRPSEHYIQIIGTGGTIRWDNANGLLSVYSESSSGWEEFSPPVDFGRNWMFMEEMQHFISVVRKEADPLCTLEDGLIALDIALQILSFKKK